MAAIVKVIEVIAESEKGFDDAMQVALKEAAETVQNIQEIYVNSMKGIVENNRIARYRVGCKVSFIVRDTRS
ncbi:hypothetical protein BH23GEM4_BH23GEM4_00300 [soil metagenome]|jgi:flavin-binding protein dodecin